MEGLDWELELASPAGLRTHSTSFHLPVKAVCEHTASQPRPPHPYTGGSINTGRWASQEALVVKKPPANAGDLRDAGLTLIEKIPWRRAWQPILVFSPGESHGQRSLVGYSP